MAYRLVRSLLYKHGVGIRETVWVGVWFGKSKSVVGVGLSLPAEPRRRSVPLHGVLDGGVGGRQRRSELKIVKQVHHWVYRLTSLGHQHWVC